MKKSTLKLLFQCGLGLCSLAGFILTLIPEAVILNISGLIIMCGFAALILITEYIVKS